MGKKKKRILDRRKAGRASDKKNRPPPLLAQGLDPPLTWWRARGCLRNVKTLVRSRRPPVSWYWIYREYIDWKIFQKCALDVRWQRHVTNVVSNKCEKNYWFVRFSLFWYYNGSLLNLFSRKKNFRIWLKRIERHCVQILLLLGYYWPVIVFLVFLCSEEAFAFSRKGRRRLKWL